jgi:hypothetical protein
VNTFTQASGYFVIAILIGVHTTIDFARRNCEVSSDATPVKPEDQGCVSKSDFARIKIGMTPQEVNQILGPQLPLIGHTGQQIILRYKVDGVRRNIFFDSNDKVCHRTGFNDPPPEYPKAFPSRS